MGEYYTEAFEHWNEVEHKRAVVRSRFTRRGFIRGTSILAAGGVAAALIGCGGDDDEATPAATQAPATGATAAPAAPATAPAGGASTEDQLKAILGEPNTAYPLVNQYNWRHVNWLAGPPKVGGTAVRAGSAPAHWDPLTVVTLTPHPPFYNGLYRPRTEAGSTLLPVETLNLDRQEFVPDLAQTSEPNGDFTEWVFTLPPDAKFHNVEPVNGRAMTAEDVVYSFDLYRNAGLWSVPLGPVDSVTAVDDHTVKFTMKHPYVALPAILGMPYYLILAREHYEGSEDRWRAQPIGTGPFMMTEFEPGQGFKGRRNPEYWERDGQGTRLPYLDGFDVIRYQDVNAGVAAFRSGNVDSYSTGTPAGLKQLVESVPDGYYVVGPHWATYQNSMIVQWKNPILADVRVRQALSMGMDRKALVDNLLEGAGTPYTPVPFDQQGLDGPPSFADMPPTMQYDPERAKALLKEAGQENLKLSMMTFSPVNDIFVGVQQQWKAIGVELEFEELDFLVFQEKLAKKDFKDLAFYSGVAGFDVDVAVRPLYYPDSPQNWGGVVDDQLTALMDSMRESSDASGRQADAKKFAERAYEIMPALFVNGYHTYSATQSWMHSFSHSLYTTPNNWAMHNWRYFWLDENTPADRRPA
ncbi:MAG: ABC transporter substrate-binding protein [Gemmatimonadaceae bacterium]